MLLKESGYRLPAALLVLTALVASVPLMASAEEEEADYTINDVDAPVNNGSALISGSVDGDDFTGLTVEFTGAVTGTLNVQSDGSFGGLLSASTGDGEATLKDGTTILDVFDYSAYL